MTTWLRTWSSPTWHEERERKGLVVHFVCGLACPADQVAHQEPEPPAKSACKHCARKIADARRSALQAIPKEPAGAKQYGRASGLAPRDGGPLASERPMPPPVLRPWPGLLTADLAAEFCSVSRRQWDRLCHRGAAPAPSRLGSSKRWARADLERWIEEGMPAREASR